MVDADEEIAGLAVAVGERLPDELVPVVGVADFEQAGGLFVVDVDLGEVELRSREVACGCVGERGEGGGAHEVVRRGVERAGVETTATAVGGVSSPERQKERAHCTRISSAYQRQFQRSAKRDS